MSPGAGIALLERRSELERVERFVRSVRDGGGALLLIDGPAGIGKTALLGRCATQPTCWVSGPGARAGQSWSASFLTG